MESAIGRLIPFADCFPRTRAMISAVTAVIGWMGMAAVRPEKHAGTPEFTVC